MTVRHEIPRPVENPDQQHLACVVLLDTSGGMRSLESQFLEGLQALVDGINNDGNARQRVELCIATFDNIVTVLESFGSMASFEMPRLPRCEGMTCMHEAIRRALELIEERKCAYRVSATPRNRPWIFLLTDGHATDSDKGAEAALFDAQNGKHCIFCGIGLGYGADTELLKRLNVNNLSFGASRDDFIGAFRFLSDCLCKASNTTPGESMTLPNPEDYQLTPIRI